ncbi:hypothetical protein B0H14DRAFT_3867819, partial [Mycena olivaceomarginata]
MIPQWQGSRSCPQLHLQLVWARTTYKTACTLRCWSTHLLLHTLPAPCIMPIITEQPVSTLTSMLPAKLLIAFLVIAGITMIIYSMLPLRLTDTLITLIAEAEETYIEAHDMGVLSAADTEMLTALRLEVSAITESTLRNSLSWRAALRDFLHGRTFTLLWWIREVKQFETHQDIEGISAVHRNQFESSGGLPPATRDGPAL